MSDTVEAAIREIAEALDQALPIAVYTYADGTRVYASIPPFPPAKSRGHRRRRTWLSRSFLGAGKQRRGSWDGEGISTEIEWPVHRSGVSFRSDYESGNWIFSHTRVAEVAAFGVVLRVVFHRSCIDD